MLELADVNIAVGLTLKQDKDMEEVVSGTVKLESTIFKKIKRGSEENR